MEVEPAGGVLVQGWVQVVEEILQPVEEKQLLSARQVIHDILLAS